ncbi:hypothetical protein TRM7557_02778 [Tritonibacter multivorans]|uniref:YHS domain protein n=1 Tax=Tritonibacter multivorans TaxID=928856 RepID=A0A0N7M0E2_9RHOB|nr:hypothetical protein TRM7557_02778 [Tritonibacter multivorans]SFC75955.1 hypothetical protein SAMN04488049_10461 [Tritonibacter multivorans]
MPLTTTDLAKPNRRLFHPLTRGVTGVLCVLCLGGVASANPGLDLRGFIGAEAQQAAALVNVQEEGLALGGFDAVSFHDPSGPLVGLPAFTLMWKGALWQFATAANLKTFEASPRKYEPRFGGYCAYAMAKGRLAEGSPLTWKIEDGQLYFFHSERAEALWDGDQSQMIQSADAAWPGVLRK